MWKMFENFSAKHFLKNSLNAYYWELHRTLLKLVLMDIESRIVLKYFLICACMYERMSQRREEDVACKSYINIIIYIYFKLWWRHCSLYAFNIFLFYYFLLRITYCVHSICFNLKITIFLRYFSIFLFVS